MCVRAASFQRMLESRVCGRALDSRVRGDDRIARTVRMTLKLRKATQSDSRFLFELRNDESVRRVSRSMGLIALAEHEAWLAKKLASSDCVLFIVEENGAPIAQIRFDRNGAESAEVSIAVVPALRGKGYGTRIIHNATRMFLQEFQDIHAVSAYVNRGNEASLRSFTKAGYRRMEDVEDGGAVRHLLAFERSTRRP